MGMGQLHSLRQVKSREDPIVALAVVLIVVNEVYKRDRNLHGGEEVCKHTII